MDNFDLKKALTGSWILLDASTTFSTGEVRQLADQGYLTYSSQGIVWAMLGASNRKTLNVPMLDLKSKNAWLSRPFKNFEALVNLFAGSTRILSYTGLYSTTTNEVQHEILMSSIKDLEGAVLTREVKLLEGKLNLIARNDQGEGCRTTLIWERVSLNQRKPF